MAQVDNQILKYLLNQGKISKEKYESIIADSGEMELSPDELLESKKIVPEETIAKAKSEIYEVPVAQLYGKSVDKDILKIIPRETAENYQIIAFDKKGGILKVAMVHPGNFKAREAVSFIARENNLKARFFTAPASAIQKILDQYTGLDAQVEKALGRAESRFASVGTGDRAAIGLEDISEAEPIAKLVASILKYAVDNEASDVHIEPVSQKTRVRYRIDGVLRETASLPGHLHSSIVSRIKVMADLKLDETRVPQDGRIRIRVSKRRVDLRVSTFPLLDKEKVVLRVLDPAQRIFSFKELGFWGKGLEIIKENIKAPHGMILITGPTGSGKTTTLYTMLKQLNQVGVNVVSLEDPIEYFMAGVNQSQVAPEIGYDFASGIRSVVRQDPDVIMVGEVRDNATADLAVHAALTGHIVLSTLHTNDAFGAVPRLMDMEIEPFLISSSVNVVLAQRLVRTICPHCKKEIEVAKEAKQKIKNTLEPLEAVNLDDFKGKDGKLHFYKGEGCPRCNDEGYKGRTAIFEVLEITDNMKDIIEEGSDIDRVKEEFRRQKMVDMLEDGYIKVLQGKTTLEEVLRAAKE